MSDAHALLQNGDALTLASLAAARLDFHDVSAVESARHIEPSACGAPRIAGGVRA